MMSRGPTLRGAFDAAVRLEAMARQYLRPSRSAGQLCCRAGKWPWSRGSLTAMGVSHGRPERRAGPCPSGNCHDGARTDPPSPSQSRPARLSRRHPEQGLRTMRPKPIDDATRFLSSSALHYVFLVLVIASLIVAGINLARDPAQRSLKHLATYALRFFIGCMCWQQTLWKLPPTYTDLPDGSGGVRYWVSKMVDGAAV